MINANFLKRARQILPIAVITAVSYKITNGLQPTYKIQDRIAPKIENVTPTMAVNHKILVVGKTNCFKKLIKNNIDITVDNIFELKEVANFAKSLGVCANVHIAVNTGMNRIGVKSIEEYEEMINSYKENNPDVRIIICTPAVAFFKNGKTEGTTNFKIQPKVLEEIKRRILTFAVLEKYECIDIYDLTYGHKDFFQKDNVHPNADGAKAIAEAVANKIKN